MKKTYIYAFLSIFFWSTVSVVAKLLLGARNNFQVLWMSSLFAAVFLLIINLATGNIKKLKAYKLKDYVISVLIGIPGGFFYYVFFYAGTKRMLASQAFIVNYIWPIMSVVMACIILKEKLTPRKIIAIVLSFFGIVIVMGNELLHFNENTGVGALLCVLGAISYGTFTALNQRFAYNKPVSLMINYFVTFALTTVINAASGDLFIPTVSEFFGFAYNGIFTVAIANTLWAIALESGNTAKISNLAYITPFVSLIWTALILKDPLRINFVIGLAVIILGIFIQLKEKRKIIKP